MTTSDKPLNKVEVWIAERAAPIFAVLVVLILLGAGAVFYTYQQSGEAAEKVKVIAPQVTRINRAICDQRSLESVARARACAERIRVGLINCRRVQSCRAAYLALATFPPPARGATSPGSAAMSTPSTGDTGGGGAQNEPKGHQQPSPGSEPGHEGGQGNGHGDGHSSPAETTPGASQGGSGGDTPADTGGGQGGGDSGSHGGSTSGVGVEVCVPRVTCIEAEVGLPDLNPKGLLP